MRRNKELLRHIISTAQFLDASLLQTIFRNAQELETKDKEGLLPSPLKNKILASVFYEASTRTRFSFEAAMLKLGGGLISTENAAYFSSVIKGESLADTIRVVAGYADVIVLRHPDQGSASIAAQVSSVPLINAGDGAGEHPTQALLDLYTIKRELGTVDGLAIGLIGDLRYGRTIHSLAQLLGLYKKIKLYLISPPQLKISKEYKNYLQKEKIQFQELADLEKILPRLDVVYITRVQKERFASEAEYEQLKNIYMINRVALNKLNKKTIIMHPLPRNREISPEVDNDPRAAYFRQAQNGLYIRMALLQLLLI